MRGLYSLYGGEENENCLTSASSSSSCSSHAESERDFYEDCLVFSLGATEVGRSARDRKRNALPKQALKECVKHSKPLAFLSLCA